MQKLEFIAVPTTDASPQQKTASRRLLAQVRWPLNHVLPQFAYSVSKTAQKPEDGWSAANVRESTNIVLKVKLQLLFRLSLLAGGGEEG